MLLAMVSFECSEPIMNLVRLSLTRAMNPDLTLGKKRSVVLVTSEKQLAEELGGWAEEICKVKHELDVLQGQVNNKRRRLVDVEKECNEVIHRLVAVQKEILGEQAPPTSGTCIDTSCRVCHPGTGGPYGTASRLPPGPPIT